MKLSYGWVVVGAGMVMTCIGIGAMMSLAVFLVPIAQQTGWSHSGISSVATIDFLFMGIGSIVWGALCDRIGARRRRDAFPADRLVRDADLRRGDHLGAHRRCGGGLGFWLP